MMPTLKVGRILRTARKRKRKMVILIIGIPVAVVGAAA